MAEVKLTPFMVQYMGAKEQHPDKLLLFRMGDFYEVFNEDAKTAASILGITLTARGAKSNNPTPMAGIPHHALGDYLPKLIDAGLKVAICDQVEDPAEAKGIVRREVVRVVTKGTLTEESLLKPNQNNYLMALCEAKGGLLMAYLDFSTGEINVRTCEAKRALDVIGVIAPDEIVVPRSFLKRELCAQLRSTLELTPSSLDDWVFNTSSSVEKVKQVYGLHSAEGLGLSIDSPLIRPLGGLLEYLAGTQMTTQLHLRKVQTVAGERHMVLDRQTCRNLELFSNQQDGGLKGTLFEALNLCATPMGARRLFNWLSQPLLEASELEERFDCVDAFQTIDLDSFRKTLGTVRDLERPLGRLRAGRYSARDMRSIAMSLLAVPSLNTMLEHEALQKRRPLPLTALAEKIDATLLEELPAILGAGDMIQSGVHEDLDHWKGIRDGGKEYLHQLQEKLKDELELPGLKVRHNKVFGYYIEVPKAQSAKVPEHFVRKQTLVNAERYIIAELKEFEDKIFSANDKVTEIEAGLIEQLRQALLDERESIMLIAQQLSELDVLSTYTHLAKRFAYVRPHISAEPRLSLGSSRHPVAERLLGLGEFCPNDIELSGEKTRMILLTGPNMAGKSTYIRQVALIQIMAQAGCFVPAAVAEMGLCDRVFTRVGAGDDLSSGRSTFMVEMNETANILHNATPQSLVILDEVGRGTSTLDGLSLAWSITEDLHNRKDLSPLCLFATHYHEMTELSQQCDHLKNYRVEVEESGDDITFLHKIVEGGADKSYGIHVARLAGLPSRVVKRAEQLLQSFEANEGDEAFSTPPAPLEEEPFSLFTIEEQDGELRRKLEEIDPDEITPLQALIFLKELKDSSK
jgi:DNA mismatch repair protein MutS